MMGNPSTTSLLSSRNGARRGSESSSSSSSSTLSFWLRCVVILTGVLGMLQWSYATRSVNLEEMESNKPIRPSTSAVQPKRDALVKQCPVSQASSSSSTTTTTATATSELLNWFTPSTDTTATAARTTIKACTHTFLDLGANNGDSLGKFITAGIPTCTAIPTTLHNNKRRRLNVFLIAAAAESSKKKKADQALRIHYNPDSGTLQVIQQQELTWDLVNWARSALQQQSRRQGVELHPEDYCYYGVEGNPVFTTKLQALEARVTASTPRPVQHAHYFTETIATNVDGPATLYLETRGNHFWGSSIYASHKTVRKSAQDHENKAVGAAVQGVTLTTLLPQIVAGTTSSTSSTESTTAASTDAAASASSSSSSSSSNNNHHLLLKIDIEGAEFVLLDEAWQSGILCRLVQEHGVRVDVMIEVHKPSKLGIGREAYTHWNRVVHPGLVACGVSITSLAA